MRIPIFIVGALVLLVFLEVTGCLNPRGFALGCLIVTVLAYVAWVKVLRRKNQLAEASTTAKIGLPDRKKLLWIVPLYLFLAAALWMSRGGPWIPRFIGVSVAILVITSLALYKS
jgi:hypothetical protein